MKHRDITAELIDARLKRTPREQLALLEGRPGAAKKERARLQRLIDAGNGDVRGPAQYEVPDDEGS